MFGNESEAAIIKVMRMREQMRPYVMQQYVDSYPRPSPPLWFVVGLVLRPRGCT